MKQYRFEKRGYYNGRLVEAGEIVWVEDNTRQEPYMKDLEAEVAEARPSRAYAVVQAAAQEMLQRQERERAARQAAAEEAARIAKEAQARVLANAQAATQSVLNQYEVDAAARADELAGKRRESEQVQADTVAAGQEEAIAAVTEIFARYDAQVAKHAEAFAILALEHQRAENAHLADANTKAQEAASAVLEQFQRGVNAGQDPATASQG